MLSSSTQVAPWESASRHTNCACTGGGASASMAGCDAGRAIGVLITTSAAVSVSVVMIFLLFFSVRFNAMSTARSTPRGSCARAARTQPRSARHRRWCCRSSSASVALISCARVASISSMALSAETPAASHPARCRRPPAQCAPDPDRASAHAQQVPGLTDSTCMGIPMHIFSAQGATKA